MTDCIPPELLYSLVYEYLDERVDDLDKILDTPTEWDIWEDEDDDPDREKRERAATLRALAAGTI